MVSRQNPPVDVETPRGGCTARHPGGPLPLSTGTLLDKFDFRLRPRAGPTWCSGTPALALSVIPPPSRSPPRLPRPGTSLLDLSNADLQRAVRAYEEMHRLRGSERRQADQSYSVTVGPTGAAKILFARRPDAFPPSDDPIRAALTSDGSAAPYHAFLESVQATLRVLVAAGTRHGVSPQEIPAAFGCPGVSRPKLLDEFYWVTITNGVKLLAPAELGRWEGVSRPGRTGGVIPLTSGLDLCTLFEYIRTQYGYKTAGERPRLHIARQDAVPRVGLAVLSTRGGIVCPPDRAGGGRGAGGHPTGAPTSCGSGHPPAQHTWKGSVLSGKSRMPGLPRVARPDPQNRRPGGCPSIGALRLAPDHKVCLHLRKPGGRDRVRGKRRRSPGGGGDRGPGPSPGQQAGRRTTRADGKLHPAQPSRIRTPATGARGIYRSGAGWTQNSDPE